jgi:leader peptidase (prepilin peptidase)/N-methyltransferase
MSTPVELIQLTAIALLLVGLAVLSLHDLRTMLLPDLYMLPLAFLALAVAFVDPIGRLNTLDCLVGGALGFYGAAAIRRVAISVAGENALGFGDVKLAGVAGLWIGWQGLLFFLLISSWLAVVVYGTAAIMARTRNRKNEEPATGSLALPFGPPLAVALAGIVLLNHAGMQVDFSLLELS